MPTLIERQIKDIEKRLAEIRPMIEEADALERALEALKSANGGSPTQGRRKVSRGRTAAPRGVRSPRGQRKEQVLGFIQKNGPSRPSEIAKALGIANSQTSSLLRKLASEDAAIKKTAKGLYAIREPKKA